MTAISFQSRSLAQKAGVFLQTFLEAAGITSQTKESDTRQRAVDLARKVAPTKVQEFERAGLEIKSQLETSQEASKLLLAEDSPFLNEAYSEPVADFLLNSGAKSDAVKAFANNLDTQLGLNTFDNIKFYPSVESSAVNGIVQTNTPVYFTDSRKPSKPIDINNRRDHLPKGFSTQSATFIYKILNWAIEKRKTSDALKAINNFVKIQASV